MRTDIQIGDEYGTLYPFQLAQVQNGQLAYQERTLDLFKPSVQIGEATYASFDPQTQAIFAQDDLSGGVGRRFQAPADSAAFKQVRYASGMDFGSYGIGPGPALATITKITNGGSLTGSFELGGYLYLLCSRIIAKYNHSAGTIASVKDLGAGVAAYSGATWLQEATEASDQASTATGATTVIDGPEDFIAQKVTPGATGYVGKVTATLTRADTVSVQTVTIGGTPTGGTFTLTYAQATTTALAHNVSAADMQAALRLLAGLSAVTVTLAGTVYTVTFTGVIGAAQYLVADGSALTGGTLPNATIGISRIGTTITGDVELAIQQDYNGRPSGSDVAVATVTPDAIPTSATSVTFRFDDSSKFLQVQGEPYWLVLRAVGADPNATIAWTRTTSGTQDGYVSTDSQNSWTATYRFVYNTFYKAITATSFVGKAAASKFLTTTDGATFTADSTYEGKHFCVFQDLIVRDCRETSAGAISWSQDGKNWSEPIAVGDPNVEVTNLLTMPNCILVCKTDSIWAVDPNTTGAPIVDVITTASPSSTNGLGACVWRQTAYVPFNGGLFFVTGDFNSAFTIPTEGDIAPTGLAEWEAPWGAGRVVAVAGDRHCLYVALSTSTTYKLFKSYDPKGKKWIGAIADLGTPTTLTHMALFDRGGTTNPLLFVSGDDDDITSITLPITANPFADASYSVNTDVSTLYYSAGTGLMPANPKAWLFETMTFIKEGAAGYAEMQYDTQDGMGYRRLRGRLFGTGILDYPPGLSSLLLDRKLIVESASATDYPVLLTSGATYTVRPSRQIKQYQFTVQVESNVSKKQLATMLGVSYASARDLANGLPVSEGSRTLVDPDGDSHEVVFRSINRTIAERTEVGRNYYEITGIGS